MKKRLLTVLSVILTFLMIGSTVSFAGLVKPIDPETFIDVEADDWFKQYVDVVASKAYMIGTHDPSDPNAKPTFEPNSPLTRAMFATVLARYHGEDIDDNKATIFRDVEVGKWFTGSIGWNQEKKIVQGYEDETFRPMRNITREELVTMIKRYVDVYEADFGKLHVTGKPAKTFTDEGQIQPYAKEAVKICVDYGLIEGYPDGSFKPKNDITRAETAAIIARLSWIAPPPTERYYKVVAELTKDNDPSLSISLSSKKHTIKETGLFAGQLAEEIFSDSNTATISNMMGTQMDRIQHYHYPGTVTVGGDSYDVKVNRDGDNVVLTAEKNGAPVTAEEWNKELDAEESLYTMRAEDFATQAGLTGEAKSAWDAAAAAFSPKKLLTVESDGSLVLLTADEYAKAVQTAGVNLGIVAEKVGGDFTGWKNLKDYLTDPSGLAIKEPDKEKYSVDTETIQNALADETNVLSPFVAKGTPYTVGEASSDYKGITLNLINLYTSRNYAAEPENVSAIVAIMKAIEIDTNTPYLGQFAVKVTVQEVEE